MHRHRFIATYLARLIQAGFQSPHRVLNDFVFSMTDFRPSDWDDDPPLTVELGEPRGFDFKVLLKGEHLIEFSGVILISIADEELLVTLAEFVLEYTLTGTIRGLSGPIGGAMVQYGMSRFKTPVLLEAQTDEPLAILAIVSFMKQKGQTYARYLRRTLNSSGPAHRGIVFEAFGAYLLARAFSAPKPLSEIFQFVARDEHRALQKESAELVTLEKVDSDFKVTPLRIDDHLRRSHILGCSPKTVDDMLKWLEDPQGSAFCFPSKNVGPDLILVLRLTGDQSLLRVSVQFKHTKELPYGETKKTTGPSTWLSQETGDEDSPTGSDPPMRTKMKKAVTALVNGTKKAGDCGLLRVLFSHPALPNDDALEEAAKGYHPLATVAIRDLDPDEPALSQTIQSLAQLAFQQPDHKRKGSDDIEEAEPMRKKKKN
jgi:hypothetical protein